MTIIQTPCVNGCVMCGMCCVALTIDDDNLQKPAYKKCRHLVYAGNKALCEIHGADPWQSHNSDCKSRGQGAL